jgi:hypothetical protein
LKYTVQSGQHQYDIKLKPNGEMPAKTTPEKEKAKAG